MDYGGPKTGFAEAVEAAIAAALEEVRFCLPGRIESYDYRTCRATVKPLLKKVYADATVAAMAAIDSVPVVWPRGSGGGASFPLQRGDGVLLLFAERNLENFLVKGGDSIPADPRKFDLSDCIAIPGLESFTVAGVAPDNVNAWFRFGGAAMKMTPDGRVAFGTPEAEVLDIIDSLIGAVEALTVTCAGAGSPSGPPLNLATFAALKTKLGNIKASL